MLRAKQWHRGAVEYAIIIYSSLSKFVWLNHVIATSTMFDSNGIETIWVLEAAVIYASVCFVNLN